MKHQLVPLDEIHVDLDDNYRSTVPEDSIRDLSKTFVSVHKRSNGGQWMLEPVQVVELEKPVDGKPYALRMGFRRILAARYTLDQKPKKYAWAAQIPAIVVEKGDEEEEGSNLLFAMIENIQREDVNPLDEAKAIQEVLDQTDMTMTDLGKTLGRSKGWVSQRLSLLDLSETVQTAMGEDSISFGHARELGRLDDDEAQTKMLDLVDMNDWDVREVKQHVDGLLKGSPSPETKFIADGHDLEKQSKKSKEKEKKKKGGGSVEVRPVTTLVEKVEELQRQLQHSEKQKEDTSSTDKKQAFEQQSAFYRGARTALSWTLGQKDDISLSELLKKESEK